MKTPPVHATGMTWYLAEDFAQIKAMMEDPHTLHKTHAEWQHATEQGEQSIRANGGLVYRAIIRPAAFKQWCDARGLKIDAKARNQFASEFAAQKYRDGHRD